MVVVVRQEGARTGVGSGRGQQEGRQALTCLTTDHSNLTGIKSGDCHGVEVMIVPIPQKDWDPIVPNSRVSLPKRRSSSRLGRQLVVCEKTGLLQRRLLTFVLVQFVLLIYSWITTHHVGLSGSCHRPRSSRSTKLNGKMNLSRSSELTTSESRFRAQMPHLSHTENLLLAFGKDTPKAPCDSALRRLSEPRHVTEFTTPYTDTRLDSFLHMGDGRLVDNYRP